jgi:Tol biopolymer transport system component
MKAARRAVPVVLLVGVLAGSYSAPAHPHRIPVGYSPHVFLAKRDGGVRRLTGDRGSEIGARWCRHGRRIVSTGDEIEVRARRDGRLLYRVSYGRGYTDGVSPSPDCRHFAVVTYGSKEVDGRLTIVGRAGKRRVLVDHAAVGCPSGFYDYDTCPSWSPDGRTLYYVRGSALWSIGSDGRSRHQMTTGIRGGPQVSPRGDWLAFTRDDNDPNVSGVWLIRPDGTDERHLLRGAYVAPKVLGWVPHRREVYVHGGGAGHQTLVISSSGKRHRIGRHFRNGGLVSLSPDGERIAWTVARSDKDTQVRSSRLDGSDYRVLARFVSKGGYTEIDTLEWSPDSSELIVVPHRHVGD